MIQKRLTNNKQDPFLHLIAGIIIIKTNCDVITTEGRESGHPHHPPLIFLIIAEWFHYQI